MFVYTSQHIYKHLQ